jgi:hypothetical protein
METFTSKIEFIKSILGDIEIARDGVNIAATCPACGSKGANKKKFSINIETWNCHCWVCGIKGKDPSNILFKHVSSSVSKQFKNRFLISRARDFELISEDNADPVVLPDGFIPLCLKLHSKDPDIRSCLDYMKNRGVSQKDLWYFKIGSTTRGKFRRRVIIPSFDLEGNLNFFSARAIDDNSYRKYINSNAKKSDIIFNEINIDWSRELTLVEGPFDLLKCNQNATCLLGSTLNKNSYLFKRIVSNKTPILLSLDADAKSKSTKIADMLMAYSCAVRVMNLENFHDVGEMSKFDFKRLKDKSTVWSREGSLMEKISTIHTGSLF